MTTAVVVALAFICGAAWSLSAVGYGVRGGVNQIIRLRRYRQKRCQCRLCQNGGDTE